MTVPQVQAPPHTTEAEEYVLGCLLADDMCHLTVPVILKPEDFYHERNRLVYEAVLAVGKADFPLVVDYLRANGLLDTCGGTLHISHLTGLVPTTANAEAYAERVRDAADKRAFQAASMAIVDIANKPADTFQTALGEATGVLIDLHQRLPAQEDSDPEEFVALRQAGEDTRRLPTNLEHLDQICFVRPGQLTVLGGSTSHGKSAFAMQLALNAARAGQHVHFWAGEMTKPELYERCIANMSWVPMMDLQKGRMTDTQWAACHRSAAELKTLPLELDCSMGASLADIEVRARAKKARQGLDWLIIDYLGLLADLNSRDDDNDRRDLLVGWALWRIRLLAKRLECHALVLHQFNSGPEKRHTGRPIMSDLRDSRQIEQHCDRVWLIYQPSRDERQPDTFRQQAEGMLELIIPKQRQGPTGMAWLEYQLRTQRIATLAMGKWPKYPEVRSRKGA